MKIKLKRALLLALIFAGISLSGCRTAEGFGEDMEAAGESIQRNAD